MSKAYKCDVCGKFCNDCYEIRGFDIYPDDFVERGYSDIGKRIQINELCESCHNDIRKYIHDKIFEAAKPGKIVSRPGKYNGGIEWVED